MKDTDDDLDRAPVPVDNLQPNVLTVDPSTGAVGADFSGHVHAAGLDLDAGTSSTPPDTDRVRWLRQSDGAMVADLFGFETAGADELWIEAIAQARVATAGLVASRAPADGQVGLFVNYDPAGPDTATSRIVLTARSFNGTLMDATGASSFLQAAKNLADLVNAATARGNLGLGSAATHAAADFLLAAQNLSDLANARAARQTGLQVGSHCWAHFTVAAGVYSITAGSQGVASIAKNALGNVTVNWSANFANTGYGVVPAALGGYAKLAGGSQAVGSIGVLLETPVGTAADLGFTIIAAGNQ